MVSSYCLISQLQVVLVGPCSGTKVGHHWFFQSFFMRFFMNIKELVLPVGLALVSVFALHYFFPSGTGQNVVVESSFVAPTEKRVYRPLNAEVDFFDQERSVVAKTTDIETAWGYITFSTDGASLDTVDFKRELNGETKTIRTVFPVTDTERENRCFLVALQDKTPFYYTLLSSEESERSYELIYAGDNDDCVIQKVFIVDKNSPKIDLLIEVAPKGGKTIKVQPRVFFPAPFMPDLQDTDVISSIVIDQSDVFAKKQTTQVDGLRGWFKPMMFGSDNRYFIHSLIGDNDHFAQRAYYKLENRTRLFSILEGPMIREKAAWRLSFYFGPKELSALAAVDYRLEKTLDYSGMFASLAKLMLYLLNWFYMFLHSYGLAIIALTMLIQIMLLPISLRNNEEKFKQQQAEYQRSLALLEQRFAGKPDQLLAEKTELMRKKGLPGFGCLVPILVNLALFFVLSRVLSSSFELYQAPMLWIPDLSRRDPYYILPALVTLVMLMQDLKGGDPQQRLTKMVMPFVFGFVTSSFSAGLVLYILMSRLFSVVQIRIMNYFKLA